MHFREFEPANYQAGDYILSRVLLKNGAKLLCCISESSNARIIKREEEYVK
jgi:hypothetical protein